MKIEEFETLDGTPMILIIDETNNQALSMSKETYEAQKAQEAQSL